MAAFGNARIAGYCKLGSADQLLPFCIPPHSPSLHDSGCLPATVRACNAKNWLRRPFQALSRSQVDQGRARSAAANSYLLIVLIAWPLSTHRQSGLATSCVPWPRKRVLASGPH